MAKAPKIGATKTRLTPQLSPTEATALYEALLFDTFDLCINLEKVDLAVSFTPSDSKYYFKEISPANTLLLPIDCPNIGSCLEQSFRQVFERGYDHAYAINSDGPSLPKKFLDQALLKLDNFDLVTMS